VAVGITAGVTTLGAIQQQVGDTTPTFGHLFDMPMDHMEIVAGTAVGTAIIMAEMVIGEITTMEIDESEVMSGQQCLIPEIIARVNA